MPRKQRFKPSRKPKPAPIEQAPDTVEIGRTSSQSVDGTRTPDSDRIEPAPDARVPPNREEAEAR